MPAVNYLVQVSCTFFFSTCAFYTLQLQLDVTFLKGMPLLPLEYTSHTLHAMYTSSLCKYQKWCQLSHPAHFVSISRRETNRHLFCFFWDCIQKASFYAPINVKPAGGGRRGIGQDFDRSLWPGGRAFEFSCCSGGRDIWIFVCARDHKSFLGVGNLVIFDLTFLPGGREFDSNLLENVKIPPWTLFRPICSTFCCNLKIICLSELECQH